MGSLAIAVIVPVGAAEAPPPEEFFERARGAGPEAGTRDRDISLVAAAHPGISSKVREAFANAGARLLLSPQPRGQRLRDAAALLPLGDSSLPVVLLFLHCDTLLPRGWDGAVHEAISRGACGGAFRLGFSGGGIRMACVAWGANLRTRVTRVPYGDQAPFVRRDVYERLGGHRPWPLLEDWDFSRRLAAAEGKRRIEILRDRVETSPRRYLARGVSRTVRLNREILRRVKRGERPEELSRLYRSGGGGASGEPAGGSPGESPR